MRQFIYTTKNSMGISAQFATLLVETIRTLDSIVVIAKADGRTTTGTELAPLIDLGIKQYETVHVTVEGNNEDTDVIALEHLFKNNL